MDSVGPPFTDKTFFSCFDLNLKAEVRKPYNNYTADLFYTKATPNGLLALGLFGGYTRGRSDVPNVAAGGIQINFSLAGGSSCCCQTAPCSSLARWVQEPAVYMPVVLAEKDQCMVTACIPPTVIQEIPVFINPDLPFVLDLSPYFSGTNISWSITTEAPDISTATISPSGVVTINFSQLRQGFTLFTITATNSCGTVTTILPIYWETA